MVIKKRKSIPLNPLYLRAETMEGYFVSFLPNFFSFVSIVRRGTIHFLLEYFAKITTAGKTTLVGDVHNGKIRLSQQYAGNANSIVNQIFKGGEAKLTLEAAATFSSTNMSCMGNVIQRNFGAIVLMNVVDHFLDSMGIGAVFLMIQQTTVFDVLVKQKPNFADQRSG